MQGMKNGRNFVKAGELFWTCERENTVYLGHGIRSIFSLKT